ncbi:hypothetical protein HDU93_007200 [Gonapodya sp. JEL0774]|nr:hypothetical protein HDU93_007200 [Gonapodya sp. JEL0774]
MSSTVDKYDIYHRAVQSPKDEVRNIIKFYAEVAQLPRTSHKTKVSGLSVDSDSTGTEPETDDDDDHDHDNDLSPSPSHSRTPTPLILREDFCGTAHISRHWARSHPARRAYGVDIDPEVVRYAETRMGKRIGDRGLAVDAEAGPEVDRVDLVVGDVIEVGKRGHNKRHGVEAVNGGGGGGAGGAALPRDRPPRTNPRPNIPIPRADIICSFNYAMFFFHRRRQLVEYLATCRKYGLRRPQGPGDIGGVLMIDLFGGSSIYSVSGGAGVGEGSGGGGGSADAGSADDSDENGEMVSSDGDPDVPRGAFSTRAAFSRSTGHGRGHGRTGVATSRMFSRRFPDFTYTFTQHPIDPLTSLVPIDLSFTFPDGSSLPRAFSYLFRVYTVTELKEALEDAGFREVHLWVAAGVEERRRRGTKGGREVTGVGRGKGREGWQGREAGERVDGRGGKWTKRGARGGKRDRDRDRYRDRRGGKQGGGGGGRRRGGRPWSDGEPEDRDDDDGNGDGDGDGTDENEDQHEDDDDDGLAEYVKVDLKGGRGMYQMVSFNVAETVCGQGNWGDLVEDLEMLERGTT